MVKLSRFVHIFEDATLEHFALFHSIKLSPIFLEYKTLGIVEVLRSGINLNLLTNEEKDFVEQLVNLGFVVSSDVYEDDLNIIQSKILQPCLATMYLILTDRCNLGCKYCFVEAGFPEGYTCSDMTWDIAKKAIDIFCKQRDRSVKDSQIWFYGGEPLLKSDLLFKCIDYLDEHDPEVVSVVISNGTLMSKKLANKFASYPKVRLSLSIDGPEHIHNQMRVYKSGVGSFASILKGVENLKNAGVNFGVSCTLAEHNVDQVVEVANWICNELGTSSIGMNFLVDTPRGFVEEEYMHKANSGLIDLFKICRENEIYESRILRKVNSFIDGVPRWHDCAACGSQIVISPLGEIGICHEGLGERNTFMGSVFDSFNFLENSKVKEWARRSPVSMPECHGCEALGICGGGCPYGSILKHGNLWAIDERFCIHSKETLEWLIWDLYDKTILR